MQRAAIIAAAVLLLSCGVATAGDGVIEINQACALNTGCMQFDAPGFPVEIQSPGSYILTSNLDTRSLGNPEVTVINVQAADVTIDMNGFQIVGPVNCSGLPPAEPRLCTPQNLINGQGISGAVSGMTVRNGSIRGVPGTGVQCGLGCRVENVSVMDSAGGGISVETGSVVDGCITSGNQFAGISASSGSTGSVVHDSSSFRNGGEGIHATLTTIRGSTFAHNRGDGIFTNSGSVVIENTIQNNNGNGIRLSTSIATGNNIRGNALFGITAVGKSAYGGNLIQDNGGTVAGGTAAVQMGTNVCDGNTTCP